MFSISLLFFNQSQFWSKQISYDLANCSWARHQSMVRLYVLHSPTQFTKLALHIQQTTQFTFHFMYLRPGGVSHVCMNAMFLARCGSVSVVDISLDTFSYLYGPSWLLGNVNVVQIKLVDDFLVRCHKSLDIKLLRCWCISRWATGPGQWSIVVKFQLCQDTNGCPNKEANIYAN